MKENIRKSDKCGYSENNIHDRFEHQYLMNPISSEVASTILMRAVNHVEN